MKVKSTAPSKRHNGTPLSLLRLALRSAATVIIEAFVLARTLDSEGSARLLPPRLFIVFGRLWLRQRCSLTKGRHFLKKKMLILFLPVYERRETRGFLIFHTELNYLTEWQVFSSESCRAKMLTGP